jgi:hypothetical protein
MPQVVVNIDGKTYRMACGEGEEPHLTALAAEVDRKIAELREGFGQIGDLRLTVMAAITATENRPIPASWSMFASATGRLSSKASMKPPRHWSASARGSARPDVPSSQAANALVGLLRCAAPLCLCR